MHKIIEILTRPFRELTKSKLFIILGALFCGALLISNILASKTFVMGAVILPTAVIVFPIVYIINDVMAEIFGFKKARSIILLGFAINLMAVIFYLVAIALPGSNAVVSDAFKTILGSTPRILLGSFTAYLVGSLLNSFVLTKMKETTNEKYLMLRCVVSTVVGETVDALIFITIAFAGILPTAVLFTMIGVQAAFKIGYEIVVYPLTRVTIKAINKLPE
jgi:queuosine precursor transporter